MDGLLLDSEDLYTECNNILLAKYGRPNLPWNIKAQLQGRPGPAASEIFHAWAQLPISPADYFAENAILQQKMFPSARPLPGVEKLLADLQASGVHMALATSSHEANFKLKTTNLVPLFEVFDQKRRVLGDDVRIPKGKGKPAPDIYLLALEMVNATLKEGEPKITPKECLVFEDSVPGVEAGRRAGMRVIWCPHPGLLNEFRGKEPEVLAGRADKASPSDAVIEGRGEVGDGWAEFLPTLENFPYKSYGIEIPN